MAVTRVFGRVDGVEVILEKSDGDRWSVPVPFDQDGEYVVEIIAEDEAGNQAYLSKMLFVVNTALLCVHVVSLPFTAILQDPGHYADLEPERYYAELIEPVCNLAERRA